jgi:hypothetical protein
MSRVKVVKQSSGGSLMQEQFNNMINGGGQANVNIIMPKMATLINSVQTLERRLTIFTKTKLCDAQARTNITTWLASYTINNFYSAAQQFLVSFKSKGYSINDTTDISNLASLYAKYLHFCETHNVHPHDEKISEMLEFIVWSEFLNNNISEGYLEYINKELSEFRESNFINVYIITFKNLAKYSQYLNIGNNYSAIPEMSRTFMLKLKGTEFCPLNEITSFNFYNAYIHGDDKEKEYIIILLAELFRLCNAVYKFVVTPDLNIDKFAATLIDGVKKYRSFIPRCDEAFDAIENSAHLFKNNFNGYYKEFVTTKNPGCILEQYIMDICSDKAKDNKKILRQFRDIMSFFNKHMSNTPINPDVRRMLKSLEDRFNTGDVSSSNMPDIDENAVIVNDILPVSNEDAEKLKRKARNQKRNARRKTAREKSRGNTQDQQEDNKEDGKELDEQDTDLNERPSDAVGRSQYRDDGRTDTTEQAQHSHKRNTDTDQLYPATTIRQRESEGSKEVDGEYNREEDREDCVDVEVDAAENEDNDEADSDLKECLLQILGSFPEPDGNDNTNEQHTKMMNDFTSILTYRDTTDNVNHEEKLDSLETSDHLLL